MKLHIERPHIEAMMTAFPGLRHLQGQLRFGNRVEVTFSQLEAAELDMTPRQIAYRIQTLNHYRREERTA